MQDPDYLDRIVANTMADPRLADLKAKTCGKPVVSAYTCYLRSRLAGMSAAEMVRQWTNAGFQNLFKYKASDIVRLRWAYEYPSTGKPCH